MNAHTIGHGTALPNVTTPTHRAPNFKSLQQQGADARAAGVPKSDNPYWVSAYAAEWNAGWEGVDPARELRWAELAENAGIIGEEYAAVLRAENGAVEPESPQAAMYRLGADWRARSIQAATLRATDVEISELHERLRRERRVAVPHLKPGEPLVMVDDEERHCDCSAFMSGNSGPHARSCTAYRPPVSTSEPAPAPPPSGDFSIGGKLWPGLSKLIEEAGEVMQVAGKLIGSEGRVDHWSGDLMAKLIEELGDLKGAIAWFVETNELDEAAIDDRASEKFKTFNQWHRDTLAKRTEANTGEPGRLV